MPAPPEGVAGLESTWAIETTLGAFGRKKLELRALEDALSGLSSKALHICFVEMV